MNSEAAVKAFHAAIIKAATQKLGRNLTAKEDEFIVSRGGFVALEMILDTVNAETKEGVERYLNSE
jgi:hypothetical protein